MEEVAVTTLRCLYPDCGHEWIPRFPRKPAVCPKCKKYGWDKPHLRKAPKGGKKHVKKTAQPQPEDSAINRFKDQQEHK